jgi:hypothetical protein
MNADELQILFAGKRDTLLCITAIHVDPRASAAKRGQEPVMFELRFMEPQSRWVLRVLFRRDFDTFVERAKRTVNWSMLLWDVIIAYLLLQLL